MYKIIITCDTNIEFTKYNIKTEVTNGELHTHAHKKKTSMFHVQHTLACTHAHRQEALRSAIRADQT